LFSFVSKKQMSSYSEYLGRKMQRTQKVLDTRPHRDAGHHTEIVKRLAASGVQEQKTNQPSGNLVLNGPTTRGVLSPYKGTHSVQDISRYTDYTAGQAVAQSAMTPKAPQISLTCYSADVMPDVNDTLRLNPEEAAKQALKNAGLNRLCCRLCGEPAQFTTACACSLTTAQQDALKDVTRRFTTPS
jgi:hypothetical protein